MAENHLTANEFLDEAKQLLPTISFATVYNSLRFLKEAGYIAEAQFGNGASRFAVKTARPNHATCERARISYSGNGHTLTNKLLIIGRGWSMIDIGSHRILSVF